MLRFPRLGRLIGLRSVSNSAGQTAERYNPKHLYPQTGTFVQSDTTPSQATKRPMPLNVVLNHHAPIKHTPTHGHKVCDLQLRAYNTPWLDFYCSFVLRVAFYLQIPAKGVRPLPVRIQRWTVIKSPFVHAKTKENFERRTHKRLIRLYDANPEVVDIFLATARKYCMPGVGMKATVYTRENVNAVEAMDQVRLDPDSALSVEVKEEVARILGEKEFKELMK